MVRLLSGVCSDPAGIDCISWWWPWGGGRWDWGCGATGSPWLLLLGSQSNIPKSAALTFSISGVTVRGTGLAETAVAGGGWFGTDNVGDDSSKSLAESLSSSVASPSCRAYPADFFFTWCPFLPDLPACLTASGGFWALLGVSFTFNSASRCCSNVGLSTGSLWTIFYKNTNLISVCPPLSYSLLPLLPSHNRNIPVHHKVLLATAKQDSGLQIYRAVSQDRHSIRTLWKWYFGF